MNFGNLKIATRLALLGVFSTVALLLVGLGGWKALQDSHERSALALSRGMALTHAVDGGAVSVSSGS